jgi:uncharacterized protein YdcH (DUF465 family)
MAKKKEPTNRDILEGMNKRFNMVFTELKKNDARFDLVFRQLTIVNTGIKEISATQKADGEVMDEMRDTLESVSKAVDADAMSIVNHESRITRLEKITK